MPDSPLKTLDILIGCWRTTGVILSEGEGEGAQMEATDVYEWFPGDQFILHHVDGMMGEAPVKALEILRYDDDKGLLSVSIDNGGQYSEYQLALEDHRWTISGVSERFEGDFNTDFTVLEGNWFAIKPGEPDRPWMHIRLEKQTA
jgi:hypothetical protein